MRALLARILHNTPPDFVRLCSVLASGPWPLNVQPFHNTPIKDWICMLITPIDSFQIHPRDEHAFVLYAAIAFDTLWFTRNRKVHDRTPADPNGLLIQIQKCFREHLTAWKEKAIQELKIWITPMEGVVKINVDAAVRPSYAVVFATITKDWRCGLELRLFRACHHS